MKKLHLGSPVVISTSASGSSEIRWLFSRSMIIVTNLGVVLDPLGCRTLYLSERNWKRGVGGPLI